MLAFALGFVLGEHPAGIDLIHAHAVFTHERVTEVSGEGHESAFGNRVGHQIRLAAPGVDAADVDHAAVSLAQMRQRSLSDEVGHHAIDLEHAAEPFRVGVVDVAEADLCGVVHHGVEFAKGCYGFLDEHLRRVFITEVFENEHGFVRAEFGKRLFAEIGFEAVDEHACAFGDATLRDGLADAGDAAGDEDDFVFEAHGWNGYDQDNAVLLSRARQSLCEMRRCTRFGECRCPEISRMKRHPRA